MEIAEYQNIYQLENNHFYYLSMNNLVLKIASRFIVAKKNNKILDAGCGTGGLAKKLVKLGKVKAVDIHSEAVKFAKLNKIDVKIASINHLPFKDNFFDLVTCIDVLYHQGVDDSKALNEVYRVLKPGGLAIIRVPALSFLKLSHDQFVHTRERYDRQKFLKKLIKIKFSILKCSYIHLYLLPVVFLEYLWEKFRKRSKSQSSIRQVPYFVNNLLFWLATFEGDISLRYDLPIGIGLLSVMRKPDLKSDE